MREGKAWPDRVRQRDCVKRREGFTLIEILVVLVIFGLMTGLVISRGAPVRTPLLMRAAMTQVTHYLRVTRTRAMAANLPLTVLFDPLGHSYGVEGGDRLALPVTLGFAFIPQAMLSQNARETRGRFGIVFTPDGGSSGGRIMFEESGRRGQIAVEWLTGRVSVIHEP